MSCYKQFEYRPDVDGLRAVAVISVVMFHMGLPPFAGGFVGVDIFFVISGFLVGRMIYCDLAVHKWSLVEFYCRRARRILPALLTVVLIVTAIGYVIFTPDEYRRFALSSISAICGAANIRFWLSTDYFSHDFNVDQMLMTWSLGVEEQFYIALPLLLIAVRNMNWKAQVMVISLICLMSLLASITISATNPTTAFYLLPTRVWELGIGVIVAIVRANTKIDIFDRIEDVFAFAGIAAILVAVTYFDRDIVFPGYAAALPALGAVVLLLTERSFINTRILSSRAVVFIGLVSYSWYLWHWPCIILYKTVNIQEQQARFWLPIVVLISFALAIISWFFIEGPFRRKKDVALQTLANYGGICALICGLLAVIVITSGFPSRLSIEAQLLQQSVETSRANSCLAGWAIATPNESAECVTVGSQSKTIAVVGDSHGAALGPGIRALAREEGWGTIVYSKASCRPLAGVTVRRRDRQSLADSCMRFMQAAFEKLENNSSVSVVVLAGFWFGPLENPDIESYASAYQSEYLLNGQQLLYIGLQRAIRALLRAGKRVVVAEDVPYMRYDPFALKMNNAIPARHAITLFLNRNIDVQSIGKEIIRSDIGTDAIVIDVAKAEGAAIVPVKDGIFANTACNNIDLLYIDRSHLSPGGAICALKPFRAILFDARD